MKCPQCTKKFTPQRNSAVYISGTDYCSPSCANAHRGAPVYKGVRYVEHEPTDDSPDAMWDTFMG